MKYSGIGGQAVMEGIMMKNKDVYAVAVRKPDGEIEVKKENCNSALTKPAITRAPFIRGIFNFIDSLVLGMKTLTYSASFFDEEEESKDTKKKDAQKKEKNASTEAESSQDNWKAVNLKEEKEKKQKCSEEKKADWKESFAMGATIAFSLVLAVGLFMVLPYFISLFIRKYSGIQSETAIVLLEGVFRIALFIGYVALISLMKDIKRVFMYHGAEHKCINCVEHGLTLTVDHVMESSKEHKRCGTSFLLIVMIISIFLFMTIKLVLPGGNAWLNVLIRILLLPIIAGISFEFIRLAGRSDNILITILSKPGLWLQGLTTREPERDMVEVAIAAVEEVFDWKAYLGENFPDTKLEETEKEAVGETSEEAAVTEEEASEEAEKEEGFGEGLKEEASKEDLKEEAPEKIENGDMP